MLKCKIAIGIALLANLTIALWAQENARQQRIRLLEQKLVVIEDYLRNRFAELKNTMQAQQRLIQQLQQQNAKLQKQLANLQTRVRLAEGQILTTKIEISGAGRVTESDEVKAPEPKTKPPLPQEYADPQIQRLAAKLKAPKTSMRMGAVVRLSKLKGEQATRALITALKDRNHYIRMLACKALGRRNARSAIEHIFLLLREQELELRICACKTLEQLTNTHGKFKADATMAKRNLMLENWRRELITKGLISKD